MLLLLGDATPSRSSSQENDTDEATHSAASAAGQSSTSGGGGGGGAGAAESLAPMRRRRASMQDALDFTKINASLYERPVSSLLYPLSLQVHLRCRVVTQTQIGLPVPIQILSNTYT